MQQERASSFQCSSNALESAVVKLHRPPFCFPEVKSFAGRRPWRVCLTVCTGTRHWINLIGVAAERWQKATDKPSGSNKQKCWFITEVKVFCSKVINWELRNAFGYKAKGRGINFLKRPLRQEDESDEITDQRKKSRRQTPGPDPKTPLHTGMPQ